MWNLKNNINKQTKEKQTHKHREQNLCSPEWRVVGGLDEKGDGTEKYKWVVTK